MTEHTRPSAFRLNLMFLGSDAEKALFADSFGFVVSLRRVIWSAILPRCISISPWSVLRSPSVTFTGLQMRWGVPPIPSTTPADNRMSATVSTRTWIAVKCSLNDIRHASRYGCFITVMKNMDTGVDHLIPCLHILCKQSSVFSLSSSTLSGKHHRGGTMPSWCDETVSETDVLYRIASVSPCQLAWRLVCHVKPTHLHP